MKSLFQVRVTKEIPTYKGLEINTIVNVTRVNARGVQVTHGGRDYFLFPHEYEKVEDNSNAG